MHYGYFVNNKEMVIDEILSVYMPEGESYTGKNQVEIFCHGGRKVIQLILDEIIADGARVAEPGEFTRLAFIAGRIDLTKAEAVAEIIAANTDSSFKAVREHLTGAYSEHINMLRNNIVDITAEIEVSIDFPEERISPATKGKLDQKIEKIIRQIIELRETYKGGKIINEGFRIVIAGRPNAGKSSLFNLLLNQERALVTSTPGTTRDYLSEWIELEGYKVNIIDTAGLRHKGGTIEKKGQKSAKKMIDRANLLIWITDISQRTWERKLSTDLKAFSGRANIMVGNKIDLSSNSLRLNQVLSEKGMIITSCKTRKGINNLKEELVKSINRMMPDLTSGLVVTSARHKQKLNSALKSLKTARKKILNDETPELTAFDLRETINALDEITGKIYNDDILEKIFSKFCIGK